MYKIEEVHISLIAHGDTIIQNGKMRTVSIKYIKYSPFMGITLYGDSYKLGAKLVKRVVFYNWIAKPNISPPIKYNAKLHSQGCRETLHHS